VNVARALLLFSSVIYHDSATRLDYLTPLMENMTIDYVSVANKNVGHICGIFVTFPSDEAENVTDEAPVNIIVSFRGIKTYIFYFFITFMYFFLYMLLFMCFIYYVHRNLSFKPEPVPGECHL
jgi:hypothetical protein